VHKVEGDVVSNRSITGNPYLYHIAGLGSLLRSSIATFAALISVILASATIALPFPPQPSTLSAIAPCGRSLCLDDGSPFPWRGVTAFALLDQVAKGRLDDARAFLKWAHDTGFTLVRVLAMNPRGWFDLPVADGRRALPRLLSIASEFSLRVQIVALANTTGQDEAFLRGQVREVGRLCSQSANCVMEIANEPYHRTQARLNDPALMRRLQQEIPDSVVVAWGAAPSDTSTSLAGGGFVIVHMARRGERWARLARMTGLEAMSRQTGKFVVDNEPTGAAERPEPSRRDDDPAAFFAQGALARVLGIGSTFHCEDCLNARIPHGVQEQAAIAFIAGATIAPDDVMLTFVPATDAGAPVRDTRTPGASPRVFAGVKGGRAWVVLIGLDGSKASWQGAWRPERRVATRPGVDVWTGTR
jgi:hypothetical protein